jgi:hypothetical protein
MVEPWQVALPASFDEASERRVLTELREWLGRWLALAPGESLTLELAPAGPESRSARIGP